MRKAERKNPVLVPIFPPSAAVLSQNNIITRSISVIHVFESFITVFSVSEASCRTLSPYFNLLIYPV